jgi:uncharacterized 2Fe-2S/4Fe-4S cluster protein (DUF4445 family)
VRVEGGDAGEPTRIERLLLRPDQLALNTRLACQLMPEGDLCIRVLSKASKSNWRDLGPSRLFSPPAHRSGRAGKPSKEATYGLAVDLGTTHISLALRDLEDGRWLSGRVGMNPQRHFGTDVLTRLIAASESPEHAQNLARIVLDAIRDALLDMASRDGFSPGTVVRIAVVGNTPMLAILTQTDSSVLLQPRFWERRIDCRLDTCQAWPGILGIHPQASLEVVSPLAGFVGSDLMAGVLATGLTDNPGGLLIDFGTNSEIALWDGNTLWVTSAAGGPAFEGCQTQCGIPAETGAIYRARRQRDSSRWHFEAIGGENGNGEGVKGFCGSGLVDLIAGLRDAGDLTSTGKFADVTCGEGILIEPANPGLRLTRGDVDMFQRAKAAIGTGIGTLLAQARMRTADLRRVCVCGAFGQYLNPRNAQAIGLLPEIAAERIELCGNTALAGCERLLFSEAAAAGLTSLRQRAAVINLSQRSDFDELFLENLYLQPFKAQL